jgi:hypothetical protein
MPCVTKFQGDTLFSLEEFLQQLVHAFWGALAGYRGDFCRNKQANSYCKEGSSSQ